MIERVSVTVSRVPVPIGSSRNSTSVHSGAPLRIACSSPPIAGHSKAKRVIGSIAKVRDAHGQCS
ncbi:hypothetical protein [Sphingobium sp. Leaf26]|uniref:hypothetical protein n=1 Tax=Sphingobium sp. Leaf26 TaxID=1735693 RepID=UPI001F2FF0E9|nr:hypothetical protein [Sphingobium sp. Leaf26]